MKHLFQENSELLIKEKDQETTMLLWECGGYLHYDQRKEDASFFGGFLYPNESRQRFAFF